MAEQGTAPQNLSSRIDQVAENAYLKIVARLSLPALAVVGLQAWGDLKDQGKIINNISVAQQVAATKLDDALRRIDNLEKFQDKIQYKGTP